MLGIYIHIPFCKSKCKYCAFYSVADTQKATLYLDALCQEMAERATKSAVQMPVDTIYIGGGTPSVLEKGSIARILETVRTYFLVEKNSEITVEANPESCSEGFCDEIRRAGVNRVSMGLQTHEDALLKEIGRPHSQSDFVQAIQNLERFGIDNIGVDLMLGLPNQELQSVLNSIEKVAGASKFVRHISLYALTVEEGTPLHQSGFRVDEDVQAEMYAQAVERLATHGFLRYEVSNFAKAGFESRHNRKYWTAQPYMGFGASAHSMEKSWTNGKPLRIENCNSIDRYINGDRIEGMHEVGLQEEKDEWIMLRLRTREGLDTNQLLDETGYDLLEERKVEIASLTELGLLCQQGKHLRVSNRGFYLLDSIILKLL